MTVLYCTVLLLEKRIMTLYCWLLFWCRAQLNFQHFCWLFRDQSTVHFIVECRLLIARRNACRQNIGSEAQAVYGSQLCHGIKITYYTGMPKATGQESSTCWSLTISRRKKKERKPCSAGFWYSASSAPTVYRAGPVLNIIPFVIVSFLQIHFRSSLSHVFCVTVSSGLF